jgi:hypothetical protein
MSRYSVRIVKKSDDPMCLRVSSGGSHKVGWYCVYRGPISDAIECLTDILSALRQVEKEPQVDQAITQGGTRSHEEKTQGTV